MTRVIKLGQVYDIDCGGFRCRECTHLEGDPGDYGCGLFGVDPSTYPGPFVPGDAGRSAVCMAAEDEFTGVPDKDGREWRDLFADLSTDEVRVIAGLVRAMRESERSGIVSEKRFPVMRYERTDAAGPLTIPWALAERAYSVYSGRYGASQSLERLAQRGGFGPGELDMFVPGWRDAESIERAAYERGLRRGMSIAREHEEALGFSVSVDWRRASEQMEREIEEAKR